MQRLSYTNHAILQFEKRFPEQLKDGVDARLAFDRAFRCAKEEKSIKNDTRMMVYLLDKYGDMDAEYRANGNMLFIIRGSLVVTVVDRSDNFYQGTKSAYRKGDSSGFRKKA